MKALAVELGPEFAVLAPDVAVAFPDSGRQGKLAKYRVCFFTMAPRERPKLVKLSPEVEASLRIGVEQAERGEFANMTPEETERYLETGELPEHVERWLESYDLRSVT